MINAELSYNPYLMETNIRFNGQPAKTEIPDKVDFVRTAINDFAAENNVPIRV